MPTRSPTCRWRTDRTDIAASIETGYPFQLGDASDGAAQVGFSNVDSLQPHASLKLSRSWDITDRA